MYPRKTSTKDDSKQIVRDHRQSRLARNGGSDNGQLRFYK